ncbi:MAG TPA: hypothetical protein VME47_08365 [Acetobacteraceae bacterium]|nr:hypothetical protein [Acetobacteraceae bacterium]
MTDPSSGLGEAILLRLSDRLSKVEQQAAISTEALRAVGESVAQLRELASGLTRDFDALRTASNDALQNFEKMRKPLQDLLDLKARLSGAWLVVTALLMVAAYLLQPILGELLHRHFGG